MAMRCRDDLQRNPRRKVAYLRINPTVPIAGLGGAGTKPFSALLQVVSAPKVGADERLQLDAIDATCRV